ncbi:hypothetical protein CR513_02702, partial [Mucuna pruriens]
MHGSSTSLLQKLALKLLVQPCSYSYCERNWNVYDPLDDNVGLLELTILSLDEQDLKAILFLDDGTIGIR